MVLFFIIAVSNFQLQRLGPFTFLVAFAIHTQHNPDSYRDELTTEHTFNLTAVSVSALLTIQLFHLSFAVSLSDKLKWLVREVVTL